MVDLYDMVGFNRWFFFLFDMIFESMKYVYCIMVDFYDKFEEEFEKEGRLGCDFYFKKLVKIIRINF